VQRRLLGRTFLFASLFALVFSQLGFTLGGVTAVRAQSSSAEAPPAAQFAPANTLALLSVDLESSSDAWKQAAVLGERLGQEITPQALVEQLVQSVIGDTGTLDFSALVHGEVALLVTNPNITGVLPGLESGDMGDPTSVIDAGRSVDPSAADGIVLVITAPNNDSTAAAINLFMISRAEQAGVTVETTTYKDVEIASLPADPENGLPGLAVAVAGDAVIAATNPSDLQAVIDVQAGDADSLAENPALPQVLGALPGESLGVGIVNGPAFTEYATSDPETTGMIAPALSGLNAVSAFTLGASDAGFTYDSRSVSTDGNPIFGTGPAFDGTLAESMPIDTQVFVNGTDFGATGVLDSVVAVVANIFFGSLGAMFEDEGFGDATPVPASPTPIPSAQELADTAYQTLSFLLGINLDTDLIGLLDGEYALGVWGIEGDDYSTTNASFIAGTSNPEQVQSSLTTLLGFIESGFGGATPEAGSGETSGMQTFDLSGLGIPQSLSVGVINDELILNLGNEGGMLRRGSLATNPTFIAATAELPAERNSLLYVDIGALGDTTGTGMNTEGTAFAAAGFTDGEMAGMHGLLYIPEQ
jgi:hypothetical protein